VLAFRGTEVGEIMDVLADLDARHVTLGGGCSNLLAHRGFVKYVNSLFLQLDLFLTTRKTQTVHVVGHSLGGAMALVFACQQLLHRTPYQLGSVVTFGQPRVLTRRSCRWFEEHGVPYRRYVNDNDIVTTVPPVKLGFEHCGKLMHFNENGLQIEAKYANTCSFRIKSYTQALLLRGDVLDFVQDHGVANYVAVLERPLLDPVGKQSRWWYILAAAAALAVLMGTVPQHPVVEGVFFL
jgi:pimeloyl-ACP methyl ester carboxylesterase